MTKEEFEKIRSEQDDFLLLDIREEDELVLAQSLPGSVHMPMGKVFTEMSKETLSKDQQIIMYCRTGGRAGIVARELTAQGYTVESIDGGLSGMTST